VATNLGVADIDMQITSADVEKQIAQFGKLPDELQKYLTTAIKQGNAVMKSAEVPRVRKFSGSTAKSITSKVKKGMLDGSVTGITGPSKNQSHIFRFMQTGRAAGANMPPVYVSDRFVEWVSQKFDVSGNEARVKAFGVARSIQQKGIKGEDIARPVMEEKRGQVLVFLSNAIQKVAEALRVR
jgi:hypothetical protein